MLLAPYVICVCLYRMTYCIICFFLSASTTVITQSHHYPKVSRAGNKLQSAKHIPGLQLYTCEKKYCTVLWKHRDKPERWRSLKTLRFGSVCTTVQTLEKGQKFSDFSWSFKLTEKLTVQYGILLVSLGLAWWKVMLCFKWLVLGISQIWIFYVSEISTEHSPSHRLELTYTIYLSPAGRTNKEYLSPCLIFI